jgi:hypothetical protein
MLSCAPTESANTYFQFGISILMYIPIIYLLIRFIFKRKNNEYDTSFKGNLSDYLLIFSSILAIVSIIIIWAYFKLYYIFVTGVQFGIGVPIMIAFIVLSVQNIKKKKSLQIETSIISSKENKKQMITFILSLVTFAFVLYFVVMFANSGIFYNSPNTEHMVIFKLCNFIHQGVVVGLSLMMIFIISKKMYSKDFELTPSNSFVAIGGVVSTFVSLVVSSLVFGLNFAKYNVASTIKYWVITFIGFAVLLIYLAMNVIYLIIYIKKNKLCCKNDI